MRGTRSENDRHSTAANDLAAGGPAADDPLPRLRRRFFGSLVLLGLLFGSLLGHLLRPEPVTLLRVEPITGGLQLWFDREPELFSQDVRGAVGMLFQARGSDAAGQLMLDGAPVGWKVQTTDKGLLLHLVAARPLQARWSGAQTEGNWRLEIQVARR